MDFVRSERAVGWHAPRAYELVGVEEAERRLRVSHIYGEEHGPPYGRFVTNLELGDGMRCAIIVYQGSARH